jgi:N-acetylmuramoyl-L-alanine amidase
MPRDWTVGSVRFGVRCNALLALSLFALLSLLLHGLLTGEVDAASVTPQKLQPAQCNHAAFRIVVDVGHTAEAPGALSARGVPEYDFNLRLAKQIEEKLIGHGFAKAILLITEGPARRGLTERVARANALKADLLVSIHHDSVPQVFKEEWEHEGQKNSYCDKFKGHSIFVSHENRNRAASYTFGSLLGRSLKANGLHYTPHYSESFMGKWRRDLVDAEAGVYRYDALIVLRTTRMPAVLLEAGSIVNRDEELLLASADHRRLIAASVVSAVDKFCASRSHRTSTARITPMKSP